MGRKRKYNTEEEKKAAIKEYQKQYYQEHKEELSEYYKQYHQEHKGDVAEYMKQYYLDNKEYKKQYYQEHREEKTEFYKQYYRQYYKTQTGRAAYLAKRYRQYDMKRGFDTSNNITSDWIVDNIFTQKCIYCGREEWQTLGADRIDNSKPHTPDNVVCCCGLCNVEKNKRYSVEEFKQYKKLYPTLVLPSKVELSETGAIKKRRNIQV